MKVLPLCCFPPIYWFGLANSGEDFVIDMHETYTKQTFRNRFDILAANGRMTLTIPVVGQKGEKIPYSEIKIAHGKWKYGHISSMRSAYGRSAFFEHYFPKVEELFRSEPEFLLDFNKKAFEIVSSFVNEKDKMSNSTEAFPYNDVSGEFTDHRFDFEPSFKSPSLKPYYQVFSDRHPFQSNLSSLDLLFNLGPKAVDYSLLIKNGEV
jgi:hypothetical protein